MVDVYIRREQCMVGWGKILRVNLSEGSVKSEPLDEDLRRKFIGGRGINSKILYDEVGSDVSDYEGYDHTLRGETGQKEQESEGLHRRSRRKRLTICRYLLE